MMQKLSCCMDCNILFYSHIAALRLLLCYLFQIICKEIKRYTLGSSPDNSITIVSFCM